MKTINELRQVINFKTYEFNSSVKYFVDNFHIDFDVYLPTKGKNLQRDFVWTIDQKRELIWSILLNRYIPRMAFLGINKTKENKKETLQIIDGKQRLSTMIDFYNNEFDLIIDNKSYYLNDLPKDYQLEIKNFYFPYVIAYEGIKNKFTDEDKINWFKYINFSGTPQDDKHLKGLN